MKMTLLPDRFPGAAAAAVLLASVAASPSVWAQTSSPPMQPAAPPAAAPPAASTPNASTPAAPTAASKRVETYIKNLHRRLKITSAEETQWDNVAEVMRENAEQVDSLSSQRSSKQGSMSAVDNLRSYEEIADAHADGLKKLVPAFEALYDSMSPEQKKNADAVFAQQAERRASRPKSKS